MDLTEYNFLHQMAAPFIVNRDLEINIVWFSVECASAPTMDAATEYPGLEQSATDAERLASPVASVDAAAAISTATPSATN